MKTFKMNKKDGKVVPGVFTTNALGKHTVFVENAGSHDVQQTHIKDLGNFLAAFLSKFYDVESITLGRTTYPVIEKTDTRVEAIDFLLINNKPYSLSTDISDFQGMNITLNDVIDAKKITIRKYTKNNQMLNAILNANQLNQKEVKNYRLNARMNNAISEHGVTALENKTLVPSGSKAMVIVKPSMVSNGRVVVPDFDTLHMYLRLYQSVESELRIYGQ